MNMASESEAYRLANSGVSHLISSASGSFSQERQRLLEANKPKVAFLQNRRDYLWNKRLALIRQIDSMARRNDVPPVLSDLIAAGLFAAVGIALAYKTIEPFHLGITGYVLSVGLGLLSPYATDRFIRRFSLQKYVGLVLDIVLFVTAIVTLVAFSDIRADVLKHQMNDGAAVVLGVVGDSSPLPDNSSEAVAELLRWAMICAAVGFELACGLSWHEFAEARRKTNAALLKKLESELMDAEQLLLAVLIELRQLMFEPSETHAKLWAEFQQGLLDGMARIGRNSHVAAILLFLAMIAGNSLQAVENLHMIVSVDLSQSERLKGLNGRSEFQENMQAVSRLLADLPSGSRVTVIGITDSSLMNPYTLLSAEISTDPGYFGSRLRSARRSLVAAWNARSKNLEPIAPHTDVLGALLYSSQILSRSHSRRKVVVLLSDMQNEAKGLDLERPLVIDVKRTLGYVEKSDLVAALPAVEVFVFGAGAHSAAKDLRYWRSLQEFWAEYFRRSGANLRVFSPGREADALRSATVLPPAKTGLP